MLPLVLLTTALATPPDGAAPAVTPGPAPRAASAPNPVHSADEAGVASLLANPTADRLVVAFFATWCTSCQKELPILEAAVAGRTGVGLLLVSLDAAKDAARVARFVGDRGLHAPVVHLLAPDPGSAVARLVPRWPDRIPVTLVLEPGGRERARFVGTVREVDLTTALTVGDAPVPAR